MDDDVDVFEVGRTHHGPLVHHHGAIISFICEFVSRLDVLVELLCGNLFILLRRAAVLEVECRVVN